MNLLLLGAILTVCSSSPSLPQNAGPDLSGTWELSVTTARGPEAATLTFRKSGDKYTGTATRGSEQATAEATLDGKAVTIVVTAQMQDGPATFTFKGEVSGDTMSGTAELGSRGSGLPWSARRPAGAIDVSGTWSVEVDTGQGTGTPSFTFKQDGDKLSGRYQGLFGEAPVTGTVKGNAIEFRVDVTVEGTAVRVTYSGTVEKDTMKGTVSFGDFGEGTFKGKRK